ncbi:MAG: hypothetical protein HYZ39_00275 [Mycolicibacterium cosmeticum]|nr:hypothetical protein [Mycolicibacterium cosmeticum]
MTESTNEHRRGHSTLWRRATTRWRAIATAFAVGGVVAASVMAAPLATASPEGDLADLINRQHVAAGCAPYEPAQQALVDVAVHNAQTLAGNNGNLTSNTLGLLQDKGFNPTAWGQMNVFNPKGLTPQGALDFWNANPTRDLISNCDMKQMGVAVWIIGTKWAASAVVGTPGGNGPPACFTSSAGTSPIINLTATYNSCNANVSVILPKCPGYDPAPPLCSVSHYNIGFGQRQGGGEPVFSGQKERDGDKPHYLFGTRPAPGPVTAYFRMQSCGRVFPFASNCDPWTDPVAIDLGNNELVAR